MAEPKAMVMPSLEIPEVSSSSNEPRKVKAEIPSFNMPTFDAPTFDVPTFGSSFDVPTFDLPTFEMETEPQKSAFTYTPEPKVESMPEPKSFQNRRFRIVNKDFEVKGYTPMCHGCRSLVRGAHHNITVNCAGHEWVENW